MKKKSIINFVLDEKEIIAAIRIAFIDKIRESDPEQYKITDFNEKNIELSCDGELENFKATLTVIQK